MRPIILGAALALFILGGCGESDTTLETAMLQGLVYEVDGQTVDRSGIDVSVLETGASATTGADGTFTFAGLEPGIYTLDFDAGGSALAGIEAHEHEHGDDLEDHEGRPVVEVKQGGDRIEIRVALENGKVRDFAIGEYDGRHAKESLHCPEGCDLEVGGKVKVSSTKERELFKLEVHGLAPGTVIDVCLDDREGDGPIRVGSAVADADGWATFLRDTGEDAELPFGVDFVEELSGFRVEILLAASEDLILIGEVPDLPAETEKEGDGEGEKDGDGEKEESAEDGDHRGKALLEAWIDGIEGHVEVRCWPREEWQRFAMDVAGLEPGDVVAFEIENHETDGFARIAIREVNGDGHAAVDTDKDLDMPFGVENVKALAGLKVRIRRWEDDNDDILLDGVVPELIRS